MQEKFNQMELDTFVEDFDEWATPTTNEQREQAEKEFDLLCKQVGLDLEVLNAWRI